MLWMAIMVGYMEAKSISATSSKIPNFGLKDKAPFICDEQIPCRLELLRLPFSPGDEDAFLKSTVKLHGGNGRPGRSPGHALDRTLASLAAQGFPPFPIPHRGKSFFDRCAIFREELAGAL